MTKDELTPDQKHNLIIRSRQDALKEMENELCHSSFVNPCIAMVNVILDQGGTVRQAELAVKAFFKGILELRGYRGLA